MHPFRFAVQVTELPREGWAGRVRWYEQLGFSRHPHPGPLHPAPVGSAHDSWRDIELSTQITHTAVAEDPAPLQEFVAEAIDVPPAAQDAAMIFLTGTPAQVRERLERRREATGVSYHVIFDPTYNYADGHVIPRGHSNAIWVRWWSRIRSIRWSGSDSRCCMCVVKLAVGCTCAMSATVGTSSWMRRGPIAARSRPSGR
jgi:hypothetical protein